MKQPFYIIGLKDNGYYRLKYIVHYSNYETAKRYVKNKKYIMGDLKNYGFNGYYIVNKNIMDIRKCHSTELIYNQVIKHNIELQPLT